MEIFTLSGVNLAYVGKKQNKRRVEWPREMNGAIPSIKVKQPAEEKRKMESVLEIPQRIKCQKKSSDT